VLLKAKYFPNEGAIGHSPSNMWKSNRRAKLINHQNMNLLENRK
jgi:hypothetical protein